MWDSQKSNNYRILIANIENKSIMKIRVHKYSGYKYGEESADMQDKNLLVLLDHISEQEYVTSEQLSQSQAIGIRTVRKRIRDLNQLLADYGAAIESKPRYGYRLLIHDRKAYEQFQSSSQTDFDELPVSREERIQFLLFYFLDQGRYSKADDLVEQLYISKGTLSADLKQIEQIANCYHIIMERRPNYGMRLRGNEFDIRRCMAKYLRDTSREELIELSKIIVAHANRYGISFSEIALDQFIRVLYVQICRISARHYIDTLSYEVSYLNENEELFIQALKKNIQEDYAIHLEKEEEKYLSLHFAGKRMVDGRMVFENQENFIIRSFIEKLVNDMLEQVYKSTSIDLRSNLQLILSLSQHMVPLDIRIRYAIFMENPMLDIIKEKHIMSYNVAIQAVSVLNEYYGISIVEDEIGLIALIFALSLKQLDKKEGHKRFRILIVCNSGKAMSQLLMVQFQQEFGEYIEEISVSDIFAIENFDFSNIDYLFTTVPIQRHVPVPIQEISLFMEPGEQASIRRFLENRSVDQILSVYCRQHFFTHIKGTTREEVLQNICKEVYKITDLEEGLFDSVMRRELLSSTDFGNMVAIPHPDRTWSDKTYVFVSILDNEIQWNRYKVKVVFLILMGGDEGEQQKEFYEITTRMVTDKEAIHNLISDETYDALVKGLVRE